MFARLSLFVDRLIRIDHSLFKDFNGRKQVVSRNLAYLFGQSIKRNFGQRLKRRLKNVLIVSLIGYGTFNICVRYCSSQSLNSIINSNEIKPRLIVLGTGWGAIPLLKHIDTQKYEVICISPRNYFLMTPLLPSVSVGTIETRTVTESIRSLIGPNIQFIEANCFHVNTKDKIIQCNINQQLNSSHNNLSTQQDWASSRVVKDSARTRPSFDMKYDILIVAIGSETNTFNTPGVKEHAHFLKELVDARRIRSAISDALESSLIPTQTDQERKRLLQFIVVGGGPTGVEFAAELSDLIHEDIKYYFPRSVIDDVKITLVQSLDHILSTMDKRISDYTEKHFRRENIEVLVNTRVKEVKEREVVIQSKDSNEVKSIPCSIVVWATGIQSRSLTNQIRQLIGLNIQTNHLCLLTDQYLRIKGINDGSIYSIGDCSTIEQNKLIDQIQILFQQIDKENQGKINLQQFQNLIQNQIKQFPQLEIFSKTIQKSFEEGDELHQGYLTLSNLRSVLEKADKKLRALPATAQVAYQQGIYLAQLLNQINSFQSNSDYQQPFRYQHKGSFAYVGADSAVLDLNDSKTFFHFKSLSGHATDYLWKSFYLTEMFTGRTKTLLAFDWIRKYFYGRDISRY